MCRKDFGALYSFNSTDFGDEPRPVWLSVFISAQTNVERQALCNGFFGLFFYFCMAEANFHNFCKKHGVEHALPSSSIDTTIQFITFSSNFFFLSLMHFGFDYINHSGYNNTFPEYILVWNERERATTSSTSTFISFFFVCFHFTWTNTQHNITYAIQISYKRSVCIYLHLNKLLDWLHSAHKHHTSYVNDGQSVNWSNHCRANGISSRSSAIHLNVCFALPFFHVSTLHTHINSILSYHIHLLYKYMNISSPSKRSHWIKLSIFMTE